MRISSKSNLIPCDPGCGKTTTLETLAYEYSDQPDRLPVLLHLSEFTGGISLEDFIIQGWGGSEVAGHWGAPELAANLNSYLEAGKLFFLFDALNEMPVEGYHERSAALRNFIDQKSAQGNRFLVTCRILDYGEELSGLQRVEVQPLSPPSVVRPFSPKAASSSTSTWSCRSYHRARQNARQEVKR